MKRAIVTGASSGIGRAAALALASIGCEVVLTARREAALKEVASEIGELATICAGDVSNRAFCEELVRFAKSAGNAYPILINAAGIAVFGPFAETSFEDLEDQISVNLMGPLYASRAILPWMLEQGGGQIINVLSVTSAQVFAGSSGYSTSKAGLHMLGKIISADYRRRGVRVTSLLPGAVDTPIWDDKKFVPKKEDMLPVEAVAEVIRDLVEMPLDRNIDELHLMPPKGVL